MADWDPGPLYRLCTDPECPVAYAYRSPFPETPHYHFVGKPMTTINILGHHWTNDEMRRYALESARLHDPDQQEGNPYDRCEHCHYTRHPCDVHELAQMVLALIDSDRTGEMESDAD